MTSSSVLDTAYALLDDGLIAGLTLDGLQHEIERGSHDRETMIRLRRRFLDLTEPKIKRAAA